MRFHCSANLIYQTEETLCSSSHAHLGGIAVDVDDGTADHLGQVRRVVSRLGAVLGRREPHLRFRQAVGKHTRAL